MAKIKKEVYIEIEHDAILRQLKDKGMTYSKIMRDALDKYLMTKANLKKIDKKLRMRFETKTVAETQKLAEGWHKVATAPYRTYKYIRSHLFKYTTQKQAIQWVDIWLEDAKIRKDRKAIIHYRLFKKDLQNPKVYAYMKDSSYTKDMTFIDYERKYNARARKRDQSNIKTSWKDKTKDA
jgi:hypothetical protein